MTDVGELLRRHGAPLPNAIEMETEVRSEGALMLQKLNVPNWAHNILSSSILAEWRCTLDREDLAALQAFVKTVLASGVTVQEAINEGFQQLDIGSYLGTFIEEGLLVDGQATVRVLFSYRSSMNSQEDINQKLHGLLTNPGALKDASDALSKLREMWRKGSNKWEGGLMMLSEVNFSDPRRFPYSRAVLDNAARTP